MKNFLIDAFRTAAQYQDIILISIKWNNGMEKWMPVDEDGYKSCVAHMLCWCLFFRAEFYIFFCYINRTTFHFLCISISAAMKESFEHVGFIVHLITSLIGTNYANSALGFHF
ncbi:unnamed protein product [Ilex paraguariensis]|uniref:Uncharacterized protein n=1 Tax=Ilex paraguariensis TaxID=185542 RepID=A0ABC8UII0_9AQUA